MRTKLTDGQPLLLHRTYYVRNARNKATPLFRAVNNPLALTSRTSWGMLGLVQLEKAPWKSGNPCPTGYIVSRGSRKREEEEEEEWIRFDDAGHEATSDRDRRWKLRFSFISCSMQCWIYWLPSCWTVPSCFLVGNISFARSIVFFLIVLRRLQWQ